MNKLLTILFILTLFTRVSGQSVSNVVARTEGEQVLITYDLAGNVGESYEVKLSCSKDGGKTFSVTPTKVSGAVNRWEAPGTAKSITWEAKKDLGEFEGNLQFKVLAAGKGGTTKPVQSAPTYTASNASGSSTGSAIAENDDMIFTITGIFNVPDGLKIFFKIKAKREIEVGFTNGTMAQDQLGNDYTVYSSDIESLGVLSGKTRKFTAGSKKDGEMILKLSKLNGGTINGRILKNLTIESTAGNLQFNDIPKI